MDILDPLTVKMMGPHINRRTVETVKKVIIPSSHHWVHTFLLALGLTTLSSSLLSFSPPVKIVFLMVFLVVSTWFIYIAKRKWSYDRPAAWVYLISSIILTVLVITALLQAIADILPPLQPQQEQQTLPKDQNLHH